ncbi:MAG: FkbM family methyltransferase [Deltaproteobacteria bacterium]|nr:MAG: FkbM family methyltransferase [Deltaproteobacteria bacterium]
MFARTRQIPAFSDRSVLEWGCGVPLRGRARAASLAAAFAALTFATACGESNDASREPANGGDTVVASPGEAPAPVERPARGNLGEAFEKIRAEHRRAEGRVGILAEERLYSHFDEELIIRDFFQDRRRGFFLDVGCAGPVKGSNTYYLEKHLEWSGIGVDALKEYAAEWKELRPNSRFVSYLVTDHSGASETFFKSFGRGISSTDPEHAAGRFWGVEWPTQELQVPSITLDDLLDREGVAKIDLLSMDIEGHEPEALAGFDIERFQPELVVIERQIENRKKREVSDYFRQHGYELIRKYRPFDTVNDYYRREDR